METMPLLEYSRRRILKPVSVTVRAPDAKEVSITGDFSNWEENGIRLVWKRGGRWSATLHLLPGEYQYRLRIDGEWADHPEALQRVPNLFGSENCILVVDG